MLPFGRSYIQHSRRPGFFINPIGLIDFFVILLTHVRHP